LAAKIGQGEVRRCVADLEILGRPLSPCRWGDDLSRPAKRTRAYRKEWWRRIAGLHLTSKVAPEELHHLAMQLRLDVAFALVIVTMTNDALDLQCVHLLLE